MEGGPEPRGSWRRLGLCVLRSRLAHFVAIGAALYALVPAEPGGDDVVVTEDQVAELIRLETRRHSDPLTQEDKRRAVDAFVEQELLVREAVQLGLERDDPTIRERLAQALVASVGRAAAEGPLTEGELRAYHAAHLERWHRPPEARFQYAFVPRAPGADPAALLDAAKKRRAELETSADAAPAAAAIRDAGPLSAAEVARILGQPVADAVFSIATGRWSEPVAASYGFYIVKVAERGEPHDAPFDAVRGQVEQAARAERGRSAREAFTRELARRYAVKVHIPAASGLPEVYRFEPTPDPTATAQIEVGP